METRNFEQFPLTSTQDSDQVTNSSLPHELIAEILLRLPIKSLLRFECVSKSWISLISSHQFIKAHLKFNSSQENQSVLILSLPYRVSHCSLESLLNEHVTNAIDIDYPPFESPFHFISAVGGCNGLFCIAITIRVTNLFLWNPCTRQSKKLADLGIRLKENNYYIAWGLGYDEINDDYKVVAVVCILDERREPCGTLVKVYSTKTGSWRRIGDFQGGYPVQPESGKFVNGKLHWSLDKQDCGYIGSLDLATEMYGEVDKPNFDEDSESHSDFEPTLDIFQGCLCLLYDKNDDHTDVWIMKEYGVRESWSKVFTIQIKKPFRPLYTSEKGEVLVLLGSKLVLYNPKDASYCDRVTYEDRSIIYYDAFVYKESLVSPLLMVQQRQEHQAGQGN